MRGVYCAKPSTTFDVSFTKAYGMGSSPKPRSAFMASLLGPSAGKQAETSNTLLNSQIRAKVDNPGTDVPLEPLKNLLLYPVCPRSRKLSGETTWMLSVTESRGPGRLLCGRARSPLGLRRSLV